MPEGDSVANDARRLRPALDGQHITSVYGTSGSLRSHSRWILGSTVAGIRTRGKHLLIDFSTGYSLHVHLGMTGRWTILNADRPVPGPARVALTTEGHHAVCFGAPTVEVDRTKAIDLALGRLGSDVLTDDFDIVDVVRRARTMNTEPIARVLLDQRVAAGIGNVYKSELAFLAGINPFTPVGELSDSQLERIFTDAQQLLAANVGPGQRTTTGNTTTDRTLWVYGRDGRPCRRCSSRIAERRLDDRVTYWCVGCQPG